MRAAGARRGPVPWPAGAARPGQRGALGGGVEKPGRAGGGASGQVRCACRRGAAPAPGPRPRPAGCGAGCGRARLVPPGAACPVRTPAALASADAGSLAPVRALTGRGRLCEARARWAALCALTVCPEAGLHLLRGFPQPQTWRVSRQGGRPSGRLLLAFRWSNSEACPMEGKDQLSEQQEQALRVPPSSPTAVTPVPLERVTPGTLPGSFLSSLRIYYRERGRASEDRESSISWFAPEWPALPPVSHMGGAWAIFRCSPRPLAGSWGQHPHGKQALQAEA